MATDTAPQVSLIKIREKELDFYTRNCISIGTQAALLAGFAYAGIIQVDIPKSADEWLQSAYLCVTTIAMAVELIALVRSTGGQGNVPARSRPDPPHGSAVQRDHVLHARPWPRAPRPRWEHAHCSGRTHGGVPSVLPLLRRR